MSTKTKISTGTGDVRDETPRAKQREMVDSLLEKGHHIHDGMHESSFNILHMAVGVAGEAGELLNRIKKATVFFDREVDIDKVVDNLGDIEFYLEGLRTALGISRGECIAANVEKLEKRYGPAAYRVERDPDPEPDPRWLEKP